MNREASDQKTSFEPEVCRAKKNISKYEKINILIVDDLKENLLALNAVLRGPEIGIFTVPSGTEALNLMINHEFAVAIVDIQMPIMDGFELAEFMRGAKKTKHIPIIFVTAANEQNFAFRGYESGAVDFLYKPIDPLAVKSKVAVFVDLFRQKRELKSQLDTIMERENGLQKAKKALEQAVRTRDDFMSIASHELKTPLTSLKLQSQIRKRGLARSDFANFTPEKLSKMFEKDEKQIARISHLIDDMLDISRISSGKLTTTLELVDLCELVRAVLDSFIDHLNLSGGPIELEICDSVFGEWDRFRIEQVVTNLLTNALRYGNGKPIKIQVRALDGIAQLIIKDEGLGIAKEDQKRIFERFERAIAKNEISGLGLGLYIVKQILDAHNGSIRVESELGLGSEFIVELPRTEI